MYRAKTITALALAEQSRTARVEQFVNLLLRRIGYNFVPQLRRINVVSIESQNLYKPLTTPGPLKYREWEHKKQQKITQQPPVSPVRSDTADKTRFDSLLYSPTDWETGGTDLTQVASWPHSIRASALSSLWSTIRLCLFDTIPACLAGSGYKAFLVFVKYL